MTHHYFGFLSIFSNFTVPVKKALKCKNTCLNTSVKGEVTDVCSTVSSAGRPFLWSTFKKKSTHVTHIIISSCITDHIMVSNWSSLKHPVVVWVIILLLEQMRGWKGDTVHCCAHEWLFDSDSATHRGHGKCQNAPLRDLRPLAKHLFSERSSMLSSMTTSSTGRCVLTSVLLTCSFPFTPIHRQPLSDSSNLLLFFYIKKPGTWLTLHCLLNV